MKIKHWQGYGSVNAKVTKKSLNFLKNEKTITIKVWGNHEWGLDRSEDYYDVHRWLLSRFDKQASYRDILNVEFTYLEDFEGQECAQYHITYKGGF